VQNLHARTPAGGRERLHGGDPTAASTAWPRQRWATAAPTPAPVFATEVAAADIRATDMVDANRRFTMTDEFLSLTRTYDFRRPDLAVDNLLVARAASLTLTAW
jgi:hypothetical protein